MSFLDRIRECNIGDTSCYTPFRVADQGVGWIKAPFLDALRAYPDVFDIRDEAVSLSSSLDDPETRTAAVDEVLRELAARGLIEHWRDEPYPVSPAWGKPALLRVERAAVPHLGVRAYGVHVNGFVGEGEDLRMWIARRAWDKPTYPGMLDNMVAGGQPAGIGLLDNVVKECWEEAGIPAPVARQARATGAVCYTGETVKGIKPDVMFVYDLKLDPGFTPRCVDGEVHEFYLWPVDEVMDRVRQTEEFKFNCNLVIIQFLVRHGFIPPEDPDYLDIVRGLAQ